LGRNFKAAELGEDFGGNVGMQKKRPAGQPRPPPFTLRREEGERIANPRVLPLDPPDFASGGRPDGDALALGNADSFHLYWTYLLYPGGGNKRVCTGT